MFDTHPDKARGLAAWGLGLTIIIVLAATLPYAGQFFSQDDFAGMNVYASNLSDFLNFFTPDPQGIRGWYRPLGFNIKFWLMHEMFGFNPLPHHLLPILLHCINILLCFRFLKRLTNRDDLPLLASVLYGLCGAHQQALYWISAGVEPMTAFFYFLGLLTYLNWRRNPSGWKVALISFLFILMLLCKESAISFPFALIITDIAFRRITSDPSPTARGNRALLLIPLLVILVLYLGFWFGMQYHPGVGAEHGYSLTFNPLMLTTNFTAYLLQVFIGNAIFYWIVQKMGGTIPRETVTHFLQSPQGIAGGLVGIFVILLVLIWFIRHWRDFFPHERKSVIWGFLWFVICLAPVLPFPGHNTAYYLNIPLIGLSACIAAIALGIGHSTAKPRTVGTIGIILLVLYVANFAINASLGAHIIPLAKRSVAGKHAFDEMIKLHPSLEPGTLLFIIDIDEETRWVLNDGLMYKAYYHKDLRWCFTIEKGQEVKWGYLIVHGWDEGGPKIFCSYDGNKFTPRDEAYFLREYKPNGG